MYEQTRLSPLWLSASSACHGLLIITVITPLPTKFVTTKMPENCLANAAITFDMQMRQRDVAALDVLRRRELADAKAENDVAHDVAAGRRRLHTKQSVSRVLTPPPAWIMQPPPRLADTAERIISPSERG